MVKVVIERHCHRGKETELSDLLTRLRLRAMRQPGYHSGETLIGAYDPSLWLVISTWSDAEQWKTWQNSPQRQEVLNKIETLLTTPVKESILNFV